MSFPGRLLDVLASIWGKSGFRRAVVILTCLALAAFAYDFSRDLGRKVSTLARTAFMGSSPEVVASNFGRHQLVRSLSENGTLFETTRDKLERTSWKTMARQLEKDRASGGNLFVHVPPSAEEFWTRLQKHSPYW
jgi:hypothetical protein